MQPERNDMKAEKRVSMHSHAFERQCYRQIVTDTKLSNASHLFFINFNNNRKRRLIFDFLPNSLCTCVHSKSLLISITTEKGASFLIFCLTLSVHVSTVSLLVRLFVSMCFSSFSIFIFLFFLHKFLSVSVSMSLFVGLFACYSAPLIVFGKCLYSYCQFRCCGTTAIFINHHPSFLCFLFFIFSSAHWGRIQDIQFERHGLPLPVRCMGKSFKVSTNYFCVAKGNLLFLSVF